MPISKHLWILAALVVAVTGAILFESLPAVAGGGSSPVEGKVICIDPGHGGDESGAIYAKRGRKGWTLVEKEINLDVSLRLQALLQADGATVVMTRESNDETVSLQDRVQTCNSASADITVSLHTNSTNSRRWDGTMTLMAKEIDRPLAEVIQPIMYNGLKEGWDGRFRDYGIKEDLWFVPLHATMPAVILEPVFMSNPDEAAALKPTIAEAGDGRRAQIAQAEYDGILAYFAWP